MAGVKDFFFSKVTITPTTENGVITGFNQSYNDWERYQCAENAGSWTSNWSFGAGGRIYETNVDFNFGSLSEGKLKLLEDVISSRGFGVISILPDNTGFYLSNEGFALSSGNIAQDIPISLRSQSQSRIRAINEVVVRSLYEPLTEYSSIMINGDNITINGKTIELYSA